MRRSVFRALALAVAAVLSVGLCGALGAGCVHVAPYEREYLARPSMDFSREGSELAFRSHVHESREGAMGGNGASGGGCGCN